MYFSKCFESEHAIGYYMVDGNNRYSASQQVVDKFVYELEKLLKIQLHMFRIDEYNIPTIYLYNVTENDAENRLYENLTEIKKLSSLLYKKQLYYFVNDNDFNRFEYTDLKQYNIKCAREFISGSKRILFLNDELDNKIKTMLVLKYNLSPYEDMSSLVHLQG